MNTQKVSSTLPTRFSNGEEYVDFFYALIKLESNFRNGSVVSMPKQVAVTLRWKDLPNGRIGANFIISYDKAVYEPKPGDKWRITRIINGTNWACVGRVVKVPQNSNEEMGLEMETSADIPRDYTTGFSVDRVMVSSSYDRMVSAIEKFALESSNDQNLLFQQILGNADVVKTESNKLQLHSVPSLPPPSPQQEKVVERAINHRLVLLDGPSGSGKTTTLLNIVYQMKNKGRILVCAPTNNVVDLIALKLHQMNLRVVRLMAENRTSLNTPTHFLSLESKISNFLSEKLSSEEASKLPDLKKVAERETLEAAEVICCTCITAGDERLSSIKFHAILIDESMQAAEPECIIPIALGCEQLVLIGDDLHLNPVILCSKAFVNGFERSLFQRLVTSGVQPLCLTVQYRMHPNLWQYPSTHYQLPVSSGVSAGERKLDALPWPNPCLPLVLFDVRGREEGSDRAYINEEEASLVEKIVTRLLRGGISATRIGVITQYVGQKNYLIQCLEKRGHRQIEVDMVDAFQGREKDIIIISSVRSDGDHGLGSLSYKPRFHLVLTRAKFGLVIVGHLPAMSKQWVWRNFLSYCLKHGVVVDELGYDKML